MTSAIHNPFLESLKNALHREASQVGFLAIEDVDRVFASLPSAALQDRVQPWMTACFGPEISADKLERGDRLLEEVFELLQSGDYPRERIRALEEYTYSREKGDPAQEAGGVMITLAAYCLAHDLNMHEAGETELARIWTKVENIRAKQAAKPTGSALPIAVTGLSAQLQDVAGLDARMQAAGMYTIAEMMGVTPLTKWKSNPAINTIDAFSEWLDRKVSEYLRMKAVYDLGDKSEDDDLYQWVLAHAGVFSTIRDQFQVVTAASAEKQEGGAK